MPKILIVDDEADLRKLLTDYFEINGYSVMTAKDSREALRKVEKQPDLVLLDINMPEQNGLQLCEKIRDFVSCPILFLTARIEDADKIAGFRAGGDDYILKPFSIRELGARVEAHIRREQRIQTKSSVRFNNELVIDYTARELYYLDKRISLPKKSLILSNCCPRILIWCLERNAYTKRFGAWTSKVTVTSSQSISGEFVTN